MKEVISSEKFQENDMALPIAFGKTISNETFVIDLAKMPFVNGWSNWTGKISRIKCYINIIALQKHPAELNLYLLTLKRLS